MTSASTISSSVEDLGEYFIKETKYYWENYKALKKPGTGVVGEFVMPQRRNNS